VAGERLMEFGQLGNSAVEFRPGRVRTQTHRSSKRNCARMPSYLTSNGQPAVTGAGPALASIGAMNRGSSSRGA